MLCENGSTGEADALNHFTPRRQGAKSQQIVFRREAPVSVQSAPAAPKGRSVFAPLRLGVSHFCFRRRRGVAVEAQSLGALGGSTFFVDFAPKSAIFSYES